MARVNAVANPKRTPRERRVNRMTNNDDDNPPRKRRGGGGAARMVTLAAQSEAELKALEAEVLASLNRAPSIIDKVAAEIFAATVIRARRLRASGKSDADERKTVIQIIRATGLRPAAPGAPVELSIEEQLRARGYEPPDGSSQPPVVFDDEDDAEEPTS